MTLLRSVRCDQVMCSVRIFIKCSSASNASQDKPQSTKLKPWQHHQPCVPTWAARSRASFFPSGPQSPNLKQYHLTMIFQKHAPQARTAPEAARQWNAMLAWPPRHASRAGKPLRMSSLSHPFFDTLARGRHLDPNSSTTIWGEGAFTARPNQ